MPRFLAAAALAALLAGCAGSDSGKSAAATTQRTTAKPAAAAKAPPKSTAPAQTILGLPPIKPGPIPGYLMIADRNNGRILIVSPTKQVVWSYSGLSDPDDAFFSPDYRQISINEEFNQSLSLISIKRHRIAWSYGHPGVRGSGEGYLSNPDDAYLLPNGLVMVADIQNCRVLFINRAKHVVREIGHAGACGHNPPTGLSSPNGATPLADGGVLVTEIGGWVDRISKSGQLLWTIRTPTSYPSDAQLLPDGNVLVAGFNTPGRVDEITPAGKVVWTYAPSGYWSLDRPSLAVRWPNGNIAVTDDWHHRVVVVDPKTKRVVWSYGHLGSPSTAAGYLNKPDGLDLLPSATTRGTASATTTGSAPAHSLPAAKPKPAAVRRVGSLPQALSRASAVALPGGRLLVLGGLAGGSSTDQVLLGTPSGLRAAGHLPVAGHDAAAVLLGGRVLLFGGGQSVSTDAIVRVDPRTGAARSAGKLDEPLSDLGAAVVGGKVYLVGGYTGAKYASAVLRYDGGGKTTTVARLPAGLRYAGVAVLGGRIYVAGGVATSGSTDAVYAVDPAAGTVRRVGTLPAPTAYGALAAAGGALYLVGGKSAAGTPLATVLRIDPGTGATSVAARLPQPLAEPAAVTLNGKIVVVGGEGSNAVYELTPR
ncbi:MAG: hypothetical protein ACXVZ4_06690 [Gaiellaceae bacterium]